MSPRDQSSCRTPTLLQTLRESNGSASRASARQYGMVPGVGSLAPVPGFGAGIALVAVGGLGDLSDSLVFGVPRSAGWLTGLPVLGAVATGRDRQRLRDGIGRTRVESPDLV